MLIDWFTVSAQMANFVILVWMMKRWVYAPLIVALDAREKRIADELSGAEAERSTAERALSALEQERSEFAARRQALYEQATREARAEQERLIESARQQAVELSARLLETIRLDAERLGHAFERRAQQEVLGAVRRILEDLSSTELEDHLAHAFIKRLGQMELASRALLEAALRTPKAEAVVRSAFELSGEQRQALVLAVTQTFSVEVSLSFETHAELVCGIELYVEGQKAVWSIADYLRSLKSMVSDLLVETGRIPMPGAASSTPKDEHERVV